MSITGPPLGLQEDDRYGKVPDEYLKERAILERCSGKPRNKTGTAAQIRKPFRLLLLLDRPEASMLQEAFHRFAESPV